MNYQTVIGLEVHVELNTNSKIFCACPVAFAQRPNSLCCPVCLGLPGAMPHLNRCVLDYALRACLALDFSISQKITFDRKNYLYPDLPKAYQTTQFFDPIGKNGKLQIVTADGTRFVSLQEMHIEEDAGKLIHESLKTVHNEPYISTKIDYNRAGIPLLEIVTEPDLYGADEAVIFLENLRSVLQFIGVSDCRMEEGAFRADVNVSVRKQAEQKLGQRAEIKNMNSFKAIAKAIDFESQRQIALLEKGSQLRQETRRWDEEKEQSFPLRTKIPDDYRYFPELDLPVIELSQEYITQIRRELPPLPQALYQQLIDEYALSVYEAKHLITSPALTSLFLETVAIAKNPKAVASWLMGELQELSKDRSCELAELKLTAQDLALIVELTASGKINRITAKEVLIKVIDDQVQAAQYIASNDLFIVKDTVLLLDAINELIEANPRVLVDYKKNKKKVTVFLVGRAMKALAGKADPQLLNKLVAQVMEIKGDKT